MPGRYAVAAIQRSVTGAGQSGGALQFPGVADAAGPPVRAAVALRVVGGAPPVNASCPSLPDGSRTVAWNAGRVEGKSGLVYAAVALLLDAGGLRSRGSLLLQGLRARVAT